MKPFDYGSLNPGIRETVRWFHDQGYPTTDSGDGKTRQFECDRTEPYVVVRVDDPKDLIDTCRSIFSDLGPIALRSDVIITGLYGPLDGKAHVDITGVHDGLTLPKIPPLDETMFALAREVLRRRKSEGRSEG